MLEDVGHEETETGTWLNTMGYVMKSDLPKQDGSVGNHSKEHMRERRRRNQLTYLQAVMLWKAEPKESAVSRGNYEDSVFARRRAMGLMAASREADMRNRAQQVTRNDFKA